MALKIQSSFTGGELDPALRERTTLTKYKDGLATGRNVIISKTGSVMSRMGRSLLNQTKLDNTKAKLYSPPNTGYYIEFGNGYVRTYTFDGTLINDVAHALVEADLVNVHFETTSIYIWIFCSGKALMKLNYVTGVFVAVNTLFEPLATAFRPYNTRTFTATGTPSGYKVDYAVSYVKNGEESSIWVITDPTHLLPIAAGQFNTMSVDLVASGALAVGVTEMKVYRKPQGGGSYGYIGSGTDFAVVAGNYVGTFIDYGGAADYTHSPFGFIGVPNRNPALNISPLEWLSPTGVVYQQRLLLSDSVYDKEAIYASRPGFQQNFYFDYPLNTASSLRFKAGSSGHAVILRMIDNNGLLVFTSVGTYINSGTLTPDNISLVKQGKWIISATVPPLIIPGGVVMVDVATNTIRNLQFNLYTNNYSGQDLSVFSNHLFLKRAITSMAFHEGAFPLLWATFDDGTYASFTYDLDQEMRAWTRHDSVTTVEQVAGTGVADTTLFLVKKGTTRYVEVTIPRRVPGATLVANPDADKNQSMALMDSIVSFDGKLNGSLKNADVFSLGLITGSWGDNLTLNCGTSGVFTNPGSGVLGTIFRVFDADGASYDLTVVHWTDSSNLIVKPNIPFPSAIGLAGGFNLYLCTNSFAGLSHMEGENVGIIVDGNVVASPNNDDQNYPIVTVTGGVVTLPDGIYGAIVHVGRPIIADTETLEIDTVEQASTFLESINIGKLYIKVYNSSGLYVGNKFPIHSIVKDMISMDNYRYDYEQDVPIIANRFQAPQTRRFEVTVPGDWKKQGKIAIRQVDPLHFEILSIIPDVEVLQRGK